jgi:hypothetical protein
MSERVQASRFLSLWERSRVRGLCGPPSREGGSKARRFKPQHNPQKIFIDRHEHYGVREDNITSLRSLNSPGWQ